MTALDEYLRIPSSFEVRCVFDVASPTDGGRPPTLVERVVDAPYVKDYDAIEGAGLRHVAREFDVSNWGKFSASIHSRRVGGAIVAFDTPGVVMLEGRRDLAVLWDIRASPAERGRGVGSALVRSVEAWAIARGCRWLKVETQNVNVPACRFYASQGFMLGVANRAVYPDLPGEVQLLWWKALSKARSKSGAADAR